MDAIRNYLESMFSRLPNTLEVMKAKDELWQMMEDKYNELIAEGKSDNEAVGVVISEFGNLDELAETLGIREVVNAPAIVDSAHTFGRVLSMDEVKDYLSDSAKSTFMHALGTLMGIVSPCAIIISAALSELSSINENMVMIPGLVLLFACIAACVLLHIFAHQMMTGWDYIKQDGCNIDFSTARYLANTRENYRYDSRMLTVIGTLCCVFCFIPLVVMGLLNMNDIFLAIGVDILLFLIGIGVMTLIMAGGKDSGCKFLLGLNDQKTISGNYVPAQAEAKESGESFMESLMSVYWPTVTCLYLIWSFMTFQWYKTWIIWIIASIIEKLICNMTGVKSQKHKKHHHKHDGQNAYGTAGGQGGKGGF